MHTETKLWILEEYLPQFLSASSGQSERIYLDAFAGEGFGLARYDPTKQIAGSPLIALRAISGDSQFTKLRFFETGAVAEKLESRLGDEFPKRDWRIYSGDCNELMADCLADLKLFRWAPTFAFLDPDGLDIHWETLRALADHKRGYGGPSRDKPEYLTEMFLLFSSSGLIRTLVENPDQVHDSVVRRTTELFGDESWRSIHESVVAKRINQSQARDEYLNLMRWKLEKELGYLWTHPFEIQITKNVPLYHMIFATCNRAGTSIMQSVYDSAAAKQSLMRQEARDRHTGQISLQLGDDSNFTYQHDPPWEPSI